MNPYGTHREALLGALWYTRASRGPVLECGAGDFSTALLHEVCAAQRRRLVTLETDQMWLSHFSHFMSPDHILQLVTTWDVDGFWDVALVDSNPVTSRKFIVTALAKRTKYIVVHDTEPANAHEYCYDLDKFTYRRDFTTELPHTTVVSNLMEIWRD